MNSLLNLGYCFARKVAQAVSVQLEAYPGPTAMDDAVQHPVSSWYTQFLTLQVTPLI